MPASNPDDFPGLLGLLIDRGVEFVLVGGLAAVAQGAPFSTFDVDIVHNRSPENVDRLLALLSDLHAHARGRPDGQRLMPDRDAFLGPGHQLLQTDLGALDVIGAIEDGLAYDALLNDALTIEIDGHEVKVIGLEKLLELKRKSTRDKDRLIASHIEAVLRLKRDS